MTAKISKPKSSEMSAEVRAMIDVRREAEQRGHFEPAGRLLYLLTAHGTINFPVVNGEGVGPDLALVLQESTPITPPEKQIGITRIEHADWNVLLVLGAWPGLPPLRKDSPKFCPKCLHDCDICEGTGKELCKGVQCGGNGWVPGKWLLCPAAGCSKELGKPNPNGCDTCHGSGQVPERLVCPMCKGTKMMLCSRCRGTKKFSTGYRNGVTDYQAPRCKFCEGTGHRGMYVMQDVKKFTNAVLQDRQRLPDRGRGPKRNWLVLGPIHTFCISDFRSGQQRVFDVTPDSMGDLLVLIVPRTPSGKAYLVGGVVRERQAQAAVAS